MRVGGTLLHVVLVLQLAMHSIECERVFRPDLARVPIVVLSNNDLRGEPHERGQGAGCADGRALIPDSQGLRSGWRHGVQLQLCAVRRHERARDDRHRRAGTSAGGV